MKKQPKPQAETRLSDTPCPRCLPLAVAGRIRMETVQRLPNGAFAPMATPGDDKYTGKCCFDCAAADTTLRVLRGVPGFIAARIAVGNCRQEQYRLPGIPLGLVQQGLVRPSKKGDMEEHHEWLEKNNWFDTRDEEAP